MKDNVYARLEISPSSGYIGIEEMFLEKDLNREYDYHCRSLQKVELIKGFELIYVLVDDVEYDGRKRSISKEDVLQRLENKGLAKRVGDGIFGGYYLPSEELTSLLEGQFKQRKQMVDKGLWRETRKTLAQ